MGQAAGLCASARSAQLGGCPKGHPSPASGVPERLFVGTNNVVLVQEAGNSESQSLRFVQHDVTHGMGRECHVRSHHRGAASCSNEMLGVHVKGEVVGGSNLRVKLGRKRA